MERVKKLAQLLDADGQPRHPMRPGQVRELEDEMNRLSKIANAPPYVHGNRGMAMKRYQDLKKVIESQRPRPIEAHRRADAIHRLR